MNQCSANISAPGSREEAPLFDRCARAFNACNQACNDEIARDARDNLTRHPR